MIGYALYFLLAVGLSVLLTATFRRLRGEDRRSSAAENEEFDRRMAQIEERFGRRTDAEDGERASRQQDD